MFISGLFLQREELKGEIKWFIQGHSGWSQVSELCSGDWTPSSSKPAVLLCCWLGRLGPVLRLSRSISRCGENCAVQENCPAPVPVPSTVRGLLDPCPSGHHAVQGFRCQWWPQGQWGDQEKAVTTESFSMLGSPCVEKGFPAVEKNSVLLVCLLKYMVHHFHKMNTKLTSACDASSQFGFFLTFFPFLPCVGCCSLGY